MTPHAGKLMAAKLAAMPDPAAAVTLSLERGWKGVFESPPNVTPFPARPAVPAFDLEAFKRDNPEFG